MEKISIVIPVYNVEEYVKYTIHSVLCQDYKNIEIILVDDGSTDKSSQICDQYASKDKRIHAYHKKNGGLSDARNFGVTKATGEYITFIDGDDVIAPDYISYLYKLIQKNHADISTCDLSYIKDMKYIEEDYNDRSFFCDSIKAINMMLYRDHVSHSACGKLFKLSLFQNKDENLNTIKAYYNQKTMKFCPISEEKIAFPVGIACEDFATIYVAFLICKNVEIGFAKKYYYINRQTSIMHKKLTEWNFQILDIIDVVENVLKHYDVQKEAFYEMKMSLYVQMMKRILFEGINSNIQYQNRILNFVKDNKGSKYNHCLRVPTRVRFEVLKVSKKCYYSLCKVENMFGSKS